MAAPKCLARQDCAGYLPNSQGRWESTTQLILRRAFLSSQFRERQELVFDTLIAAIMGPADCSRAPQATPWETRATDNIPDLYPVK